MVLATSTILLIGGYFSYSSYQKDINQHKKIEFTKLKTIVNSLSIQISGDVHQKVIEKHQNIDDIKTNNQDTNYLSIQQLLEQTKIKNNLTTDIYTIVVNQKQPKKSFFGISSSNPYFRHQYTPPSETLIHLNQTHTFGPYTDKHGSWISAFSPIKNSKNENVAIVQADIKFDDFIEQSKQKALNELITIGTSVLTILIIILFILHVMLNSLHKRQNLLLKEFKNLDQLSLQIESFLERILSGNFKEEENLTYNETDNGIYKSIIETEKKVAIAAKKENQSQWILAGKNEVNSILQKNDSIENLCFQLIKFIVGYSNAVQGCLYLFDNQTQILKMNAKYAYNRKKHSHSDFKIGDGLVGQCGFEKATIYRTEIPEDYTFITSGLIEDKKPSALLFVPLLNNKDLLGVIEFASIHKFNNAQIAFIEEVAQLSAQTIFNIQTNLQTKRFLDDALKMSEELNQQKLTLEQNAEEMKATQEEIVRTNQKLEEQIQEVENQQNKLNALLSQSEEIISIYDPMMVVKYKSPSVEKILGYKPEELIGKNDFKLSGKEGLTAIMGMFERLMDHPTEMQTIEFKSERKDGTEVWLEASGQNMINNPAINGIIISTRDITERRGAEKEQEMRAKMQALSENSQDIIIRFDLNGNFQYVNARLRHYTGISTRFSGKNFNDVGINPDIVRRWDKILKDMQKSPKLIQREMFFETEVDEFIMQVNAIPEFDKNKNLETVLIVSHDITKRKKQEILIQDTNQKITESINYAKRIQNAIIPMEEEIKKDFNDFLMFYMPKDVVSGDFPWYYKKDDYVYIAAVDCTGHGVPGAMMSLIGCLLLNDIVNDNENPTPGDILLRLHKAVVNTLKQDVEGNNTSDGMDVALCRISLNSNEVQFAGAHRPLYILRNNEIEQFKGSPFPIGGMQYRGRNKYKTYTYEYKKGESMFFFSDGLPDQFGANGEDKYSPQRIRDLILQHQDKSMKELEYIFKEDLNQWMGEEKQLDDVLLMGISF